MKYLLDTNVYVDASRSAGRRDQFRSAFFPLLPATYLSAVVACELMVAAADRRSRAYVEDFIRPLERTGRIVTPTFDDWTEAAALMAAIERRDRGWRSKLPALLNDILIALSARRIGAMVLTRNREDFLLIRRHKGFSLRVLE
ncbi:MAG: type II toxin-antitoxin system VapC family toxin [Candidatus Rokubacteria bacterium]|nr:type II toxin-antitoxin system VapC family toxin [Candidatus Rokubacteria bacterium]